jgi:Hom_end-associated Hint
MANPITIQNPYSVDPSTYISQATAPMAGGMPQFAQMTPANYGGNSYYGPTHAALSQAFQQALQQQIGVPGLLAQMQANPAMAQRVGGLLGSSFTPPAYPHYTADWAGYDKQIADAAAAAAAAKAAQDAANSGGGDNGWGGTSCFMAGSPVVMADGTIKPIEDVKIGEYVKGAYGEANKVLAYDRPLLGDRRMFIINGEHRTTDEHTHMRSDRTFGMINLDTWLKNENFTKQEVIIDDNGTIEMWRMPGTDDMNVVKQLELGEELWTVDGPKELVSVTSEELPPETQLYNLVLDGSHTYFVDGYCVTGFINGRDFDYKTWTNSTSPWTADDYRK